MKGPGRALVGGLLCAAACAGAGALAGPPAGVAAYACTAAGAVYLLAFDPAPKRRAWGHLGGRAEPGEAPAQTALREFHEESRCAFEITPDLRAALVGPSVAPNGFHTYVLRVPHLAAARIAEPRACKDVEREQWVWVGHSELMAALGDAGHTPAVADGAPQRVRLWAPARNSLLQARDEGVLPRLDPC